MVSTGRIKKGVPVTIHSNPGKKLNARGTVHDWSETATSGNSTIDNTKTGLGTKIYHPRHNSTKNFVTDYEYESSTATINRETGDETYVTNISDPNQLLEFATYNTLFTLSALHEDELTDPVSYFNKPPHDIIVRSAGIGPDANKNINPLSAKNQEVINQNERMEETLKKSDAEFRSNRDLYFKSVRMQSVPGPNEKRRLTSVTLLDMEIVEPAGISLLERVRAAAANNNYLDHIDAPFLLTIEWKGFDENSIPMSTAQQQNLKRIIPIKITNMELDVNQGGTVYQVQAIPYNEFGFVNRYAYTRTAGTLPAGASIKDSFQTLEDLLNQQNIDEAENMKLVEEPDQYSIVLDPIFEGEEPIDVSDIGKIAMSPQRQNLEASYNTPPGLKAGQIKIGMNIETILSNLMKQLSRYKGDPRAEWEAKVRKQMALAQTKGGSKEVYELQKNNTDFHFMYFKIKSSVVPISGSFDKIRNQNPKLITYHVVPYFIHAYNLSIPGVSTGDNYKNFVYKTYNYIFTGNNVDLLNVDIKYNYGYYQSRLKYVDSNTDRQNTIVDNKPDLTGSYVNATELFADPPLTLRSDVGTAKSSGAGIEQKQGANIDQFIDVITHPLADMVNVKLEILGDPSWMGQSQFIPTNVEKVGPGVGYDRGVEHFQGNKNALWNSKLRCYNTDVAEPIIMLNFRMPTDLNNQTGLYELGSRESASFSGLYKVVQIEHRIEEGVYTCILDCTRFNNQGVIISSPSPLVAIKRRDGTTSDIVTLKEFNARFKNLEGEFINLGRTFTNLINEVIGNNFTKVKSKIKSSFKGFFK